MKLQLIPLNNLREGLLFTGNMELFKDALINFLLLALGAIIGLKVFSKMHQTGCLSIIKI